MRERERAGQKVREARKEEVEVGFASREKRHGRRGEPALLSSLLCSSLLFFSLLCSSLTCCRRSKRENPSRLASSAAKMRKRQGERAARDKIERKEEKTTRQLDARASSSSEAGREVIFSHFCRREGRKPTMLSRVSSRASRATSAAAAAAAAYERPSSSSKARAPVRSSPANTARNSLLRTPRTLALSSSSTSASSFAPRRRAAARASSEQFDGDARYEEKDMRYGPDERIPVTVSERKEGNRVVHLASSN